jgi:hypothetical protein
MAASQTSIEAVITSPNMHKTSITPIKEQVNEEMTMSMANEDEITAATLNEENTLAMVIRASMNGTNNIPTKEDKTTMASPQEISARATTHENDNKNASHLHNETPSMANEDEITAATLNEKRLSQW